MLMMEAAGALRQWWKKAITDPTRCLDEAGERPINPRLSLKGLVGAFACLALGVLLSFSVFLAERIISACNDSSISSLFARIKLQRTKQRTYRY